MKVKPKIVASRDFFPTCDIEATTSHFAKHFTKWLQLHQRSHFIRVTTATAEALPKEP
jgi:hypothetical protein